MRGPWESQEACGHSASAVGSGATAATADHAVGDAFGLDGVSADAVLRTSGGTLDRLPTARNSRRHMRRSRSGTLLRSIDPDREQGSTPRGGYVVPDDALPRGGNIPPSACGKWIWPRSRSGTRLAAKADVGRPDGYVRDGPDERLLERCDAASPIESRRHRATGVRFVPLRCEVIGPEGIGGL